jgi:hypothetical protein
MRTVAAPLVLWSFTCQLHIFRSAESSCVVPERGIGVTAEDGTDSPAEQPAFNPPGYSDLVDQGLPSATSSLRVRAQSHSSYSRIHLHVNG